MVDLNGLISSILVPRAASHDSAELVKVVTPRRGRPWEQRRLRVNGAEVRRPRLTAERLGVRGVPCMPSGRRS